MRIEDILEKNQKKIKRLDPDNMKLFSPRIATEDRPYDIKNFEDPKTNKIKIDKKNQLTADSSIKNKQTKEKKEVSNRYQTDIKEVSQQVSKGYQTGIEKDIKRVSNRYPQESVQTEIGIKEVSQQVSKKYENGYQTGIKEVSIQPINQLVGIQRKIIIFLYNDSKIKGSQSTNQLTLEHIGSCLNIQKNNVKLALIRLQKKGLIIRSSAKTGRGGWTIFHINNLTYQELLRMDKQGFLFDSEIKTGIKEVSQQVSQRVSSASSSSNIDLNYKDTTIIEGSADDLPPDWKSIDCSPLAEIRFGLPHIRQIFRKGLLTVDQVQSSIEAFAFDIRVNGKEEQVKDPLRFFIGILIKGVVYNPPRNYVDPVEESLRKHAEFQKIAREKREQALNYVKEEEFKRWSSELPEAEHETFIPENFKDLGRFTPKHVMAEAKEQGMKKYFNGFIWPDIQRNLGIKVPVDEGSAE